MRACAPVRLVGQPAFAGMWLTPVSTSRLRYWPPMGGTRATAATSCVSARSLLSGQMDSFALSARSKSRRLSQAPQASSERVSLMGAQAESKSVPDSARIEMRLCPPLT